MKTLEYYWGDGTHTVFDGYTIDENSVIVNKSGHVMTQHKNRDGYYNVSLRHEGTQRGIRVARALASTFLGPPPTLKHTAEHKYRNRTDNTLKNIVWLDKSGQAKNRNMPEDHKSAFIIEKNGVEHTAKDWLKFYKKADGSSYTIKHIRELARKKKNGFQYKAFQNLPREIWKSITWSKNSQGEWYISSRSRVKYMSKHAEVVMTADQLSTRAGYPTIQINGRNWYCHELVFMVFKPWSYKMKNKYDVIMHVDDERLDFTSHRLKIGTPSKNTKDAYKNGKYDGTKSAQKPVLSYVNGEFEKRHESLSNAVQYLKENGYSLKESSCVSYALKNDVTRYGRTWKFAE
ncbi:hypothetical protein ATCVGM07011_952L [Acanthocystis turfacea Chlorella virus GM0701.1]|nr:hypothetical protein ATCVGM07011_952L [Acanthocystis turfacea Chlorella virus GM0701.1]